MNKEYEQMEIDTTLRSERDLKENTTTMIKFVYDQMMQEQEPSKVKNKHEGYGIAAEAYSNLAGSMKAINGDMATFLKILAASEQDAINVCSALYASSAAAAVKAIQMAAECQRILNDIYYGEDGGRSAQEAFEASIAELEDGDGFEETEAMDTEETNNLEEEEINE